jgi:hypothetical protein
MCERIWTLPERALGAALAQLGDAVRGRSCAIVILAKDDEQKGNEPRLYYIPGEGARDSLRTLGEIYVSRSIMGNYATEPAPVQRFSPYVVRIKAEVCRFTMGAAFGLSAGEYESPKGLLEEVR